jgi:hypothetical protein
MRNVDIAALVKAKWCNQASARNVIFDQMLRRNAHTQPACSSLNGQ